MTKWLNPVLPPSQPCFSDKTKNLEAYVKWFNRLCYLVATEICMVRGDPAQAGMAHGQGWGDQKSFWSPSIPKPRTRLGTPLGRQVSPGLPAVTFPLWAEPGTGPLASDRGCQRPRPEGAQGFSAPPPPSVPGLPGLLGPQPALLGSLGF